MSFELAKKIIIPLQKNNRIKGLNSPIWLVVNKYGELDDTYNRVNFSDSFKFQNDNGFGGSLISLKNDLNVDSFLNNFISKVVINNIKELKKKINK
jgi:hypothetical protein